MSPLLFSPSVCLLLLYYHSFVFWLWKLTIWPILFPTHVSSVSEQLSSSSSLFELFGTSMLCWILLVSTPCRFLLSFLLKVCFVLFLIFLSYYYPYFVLLHTLEILIIIGCFVSFYERVKCIPLIFCYFKIARYNIVNNTVTECCINVLAIVHF